MTPHSILTVYFPLLTTLSFRANISAKTYILVFTTYALPDMWIDFYEHEYFPIYHEFGGKVFKYKMCVSPFYHILSQQHMLHC